MKEKWKDIEGYEGLYKISSHGRVKSLAKSWISGKGGIHYHPDKIHITAPDSYGYYITTLYKNGEKRSFKVHRLVAIYFIPNPLNLPEVNHKKGNKKHNKVFQLEWVTKSENELHAWRTGLKMHTKGENHPLTSLTKEEVSSIISLRKRNKTKYKDLAKVFNISITSVHNIIKQKTWQ